MSNRPFVVHRLESLSSPSLPPKTDPVVTSKNLSLLFLLLKSPTTPPVFLSSRSSDRTRFRTPYFFPRLRTPSLTTITEGSPEVYDPFLKSEPGYPPPTATDQRLLLLHLPTSSRGLTRYLSPQSRKPRLSDSVKKCTDGP